MKKETTWFEHLKDSTGPRIHLLGSDPNALTDVLESAEQIQFKVFRLDLAEVGSKSELLELIAKEMRFPNYFGRNWDALLDMLSDLSWWNDQRGFLLVMSGSDELLNRAPEDFTTFFEVVLSAIERMRSWGKQMHAVLTEVPRFQLETAVGVMALCDDS